VNISQKNLLEFVLLLLLITVFTALENSFLAMLPFHLGRFQFLHIVIFYLALTRSWGHLCILSMFLAYAANTNSALSTGVHISTLMWTAYVIKITSYTLSFESRYSFVSLSLFAHLSLSIFIWSLNGLLYRSIPLKDMLATLPGSSLGICITAYLIYPLLVKWDQYFEHEPEDARDFNPSI